MCRHRAGQPCNPAQLPRACQCRGGGGQRRGRLRLPPLRLCRRHALLALQALALQLALPARMPHVLGSQAAVDCGASPALYYCRSGAQTSQPVIKVSCPPVIKVSPHRREAHSLLARSAGCLCGRASLRIAPAAAAASPGGTRSRPAPARAAPGCAAKQLSQAVHCCGAEGGGGGLGGLHTLQGRRRWRLGAHRLVGLLRAAIADRQLARAGLPGHRLRPRPSCGWRGGAYAPHVTQHPGGRGRALEPAGGTLASGRQVIGIKHGALLLLWLSPVRPLLGGGAVGS